MDLTKQFFKYVSQNIFGLLGTSCYILADTYFIAQAAGTDGVTLLNLCLPIYNFIFAIGSMIALGSATRYAIAKAQNDARGQRYFSNAILCAVLASIPWMLAGAFVPGALLRFMGGDAGIVALGIPYARIFLLFTPFFMCNYIVSAFVRNDGDPSLAMVATLSGSLFNVVFDYIFMFPLGLGLAGAALDVFVPEPLPQDHYLWTTKNLLITPHVAGNMSLGYTRDKDVDMFCEDLENFAAGRPLAHLVNRKLGY